MDPTTRNDDSASMFSVDSAEAQLARTPTFNLLLVASSGKTIPLVPALLEGVFGVKNVVRQRLSLFLFQFLSLSQFYLLPHRSPDVALSLLVGMRTRLTRESKKAVLSNPKATNASLSISRFRLQTQGSTSKVEVSTRPQSRFMRSGTWQTVRKVEAVLGLGQENKCNLAVS